MIRRRVYPSTYDRTSWEARQSDVPSQHMATGDPYDNTYQADIADLGADQMADNAAAQDIGAAQDGAGGGGPPPAGSGTPGRSFVRHTFESRPVSARDFASPSAANAGIFTTDNSGAFTVPLGYIAIVKEVYFRPSARGNLTIDKYGFGIFPLYITLLVNGLAQQGFTNLNVSAGFPGGLGLTCFLMLQPGDIISGAASGAGLPSDNIAAIPVGFNFYGVLIPNDGRNLPEQAGNAQCEPVCIDATSIAALKPPPLVLPTPNGPVVVTDNNLPKSIGFNQPLGSPPQKNCPLPPAVSVLDYLACMNA